MSKESVASLRDVDVGIVGRIDLKRRVLKAFALKLVTTRDVVDASCAHIGARVQSMDAPVEVGSCRAAKRLKPDAEWSIDTAAIGRESLITDGVTKSFGGPLREGESAVEKVRFAKVIRIVRARNERRRADVQI